MVSLANHLTLTYGKGYSRPNLFRMIKFAKQFPNREIVSTLSRQLSWSHFVLISAIDDQLKRDFYGEMGSVASVRASYDFGQNRLTPDTLRHQICKIVERRL